MRFLTAAVALLPTLTSAHTIAQRVRVNGVDNGQGNGIRVATSNNPILNVNDGNIACNANPSSSSKVIDVKAGDKVGVQWGHVVGGAQYVPSSPLISALYPLLHPPSLFNHPLIF
jgi:cellulase